MVSIRHFEYGDWQTLKDNYADIPKEDIIKMIDDWNALNYNGNYFEMFAVDYDGKTVGAVSLYNQGNEMEVGPFIFQEQRGKGYGLEAVRLVLEKAKNYGCKTAVAHIRKDNIPSLGLHEKLSFTFRREYVNSKSSEMIELLKKL